MASPHSASGQQRSCTNFCKSKTGAPNLKRLEPVQELKGRDNAKVPETLSAKLDPSLWMFALSE
eukprot:4152548-Amphidinium_carterae.1